MAIAFGESPESKCCRNKCLPDAPEYEKVCCPDPCNPCQKKVCPPRTCAADTIKIAKDEAERCFTFKQMGCNGRPIPAIRTCLKMDVRRKGFCEVLLEILPYRVTEYNSVCFKWGDVFKSLPKGYYECDIYVNNECCTHVLLYVPGCETIVADSEGVHVEGCGGAMSSNSCCGYAQFDEEIVEPRGSGCNEGCSTC